MTGFAYNNAKNANTSHMFFELNCRYYPYILYKKNVDPHSKSKAIDKLTRELRNFVEIC